jgi:hypothetical protein
MKAYIRAQACLNEDVDCLTNWDFDYLYLRKVRPQKEGSFQRQVNLLEKLLRESGKYLIVYDSETAVIFISPSP